MKLLAPAPLLAALCALGVCSASASAATEAPGWELSATTYPSNLVHGTDEVQEVQASAEAGTFTLTFEEDHTPAIPYEAPASTVQADLEALPSVGADNVEVIGSGTAGGYDITFTGTLANMKLPELETEGASVSVKTEGSSSGTIGIDVFNIGAAASSGTITVTDTLPSGLKAKEAGELRTIGEAFNERWGIDPRIGHQLWDCTGNGPGHAPSVAGATVVTCVNDPEDLLVFQGGGGVPGGGSPAKEKNNPQPPIGITVEAGADAPSLTNNVAISGGGASAPASTQNSVTVGPEPVRTGLTGWDAWVSNADGTIDTQAGSHPYELTTVFDLATTLNAAKEGKLVGGEVRDMEVQVPPGLIGDTSTLPQCTRAQLAVGETGICPQAAEVGTLKAETLNLGITHPIFNMAPPPGEPAEFGFKFGGVSVYIDFSVRSGSNYGITAHINNIAEREAVQGVVTLWGVPEAKSHNRWRGGGPGGCSQEQMEQSPVNVEGEEENYCSAPQHPLITPLLTMPTACGAAQPFLIRELSGWQQPGAKSELSSVSHDASDKEVGFTGCEDLAFGPSITAAPDTAKADASSGLTVEVMPPLGGLEDPSGLGSTDLADTTVTLPAGFAVNPGQASGLQACSRSEAALEALSGGENNEASACPPASKLGTVIIKSPLIEGAQEKQMEGNVYLLQSNPPEIKLLIAASADGVNVKLAGVVHLNEETGQATATFAGTPQLPFTLFKLTFSGDPHAALTTPTTCGSYTANALFTSWGAPFVPQFPGSAAFNISESSAGGVCPSSPLPFTPTLTAGTTSNQAGAFTELSMQLQRPDDQQRIDKLQFTMPKGLAGMISSVPLCPEAQAEAGSCPGASQIGHALVTSGPGQYPLTLPQPGDPELPIYLTGPYGGAPFGLSIVTPVVAGPFNLGTIITRAKIEIDPRTAQVTITTNPLPQIVKGVPTDIRSIEAVIDRPGFTFNPTNCSSASFTGTASGTPPPAVGGAGATASVESRFQAGACRELAFTPKLTVGTGGKASKANGASLSFKVAYPKGSMGTQAWFGAAKFDIPKQLPARLTTLQQACLAAVFESNRAACPKASAVGHAIVKTPVLPVPLTGSVYLVSYGGAKFPDAVMVLQGDNVTVELTGETFINKKTGVTSVTYRGTPDVPFETLEVSLPTGPFSEFGTNLPAKDKYNLCGQKLKLPNALVAQNGLEIHQSTAISVTGCATKKKAKKPTKKAAKTHKK